MAPSCRNAMTSCLHVLVVFLFIVLDYHVSSALSKKRHSSTSSYTDISCNGVEYLYSRNVGNEAIPAKPIKGPILTVCEETRDRHGDQSCCTMEMEKKMLRTGEDFLRKQLKNNNNKLRSEIKTGIRTYIEHLDTSIKKSSKSIHHLLSNTFHIPKHSITKTVDTLFSDIRRFIKSNNDNSDEGNDNAIRKITNNFLSELFPLVFQHVLTSPHSRTSSASIPNNNAALSNCLRRKYNDIKPFGQTASYIFTETKHALLRVKAFIDALETLLRTLHVTEQLSINESCNKALAKMQFCSMCSGYVDVTVKPCRGFCLNVMRGCLSPFGILSPSWINVVRSVRNYKVGLKSIKYAYELLTYFNLNVTTAIMHAMKIAPKIHQHAIKHCQNEANGVVGKLDVFTPNAKIHTVMPLRGTHPSYHTTALKNIGSLVDSLHDSKELLGRAADTLCRSSDLFERDKHSETCWNGTNVARYTREIAKPDEFSLMSKNLEVLINFDLSKKLIDMKMALVAQKEKMDSLFKPNPSVSELVDGSGKIPYTDDEDVIGDDSGSGSGSDEVDAISEEPIDRLTPTNKGKTNVPTTAPQTTEDGSKTGGPRITATTDNRAITHPPAVSRSTKGTQIDYNINKVGHDNDKVDNDKNIKINENDNNNDIGDRNNQNIGDNDNNNNINKSGDNVEDSINNNNNKEEENNYNGNEGPENSSSSLRNSFSLRWFSVIPFLILSIQFSIPQFYRRIVLL